MGPVLGGDGSDRGVGLVRFVDVSHPPPFLDSSEMIKMVSMARVGAEDSRRTVESTRRMIAESQAALERYDSHQHVLHLAPLNGATLASGETGLPASAESHVWQCLVKIKWADVLDLRVVECFESEHGIYLKIPVEDYDPDGAHLRSEWTLRVPSTWLVRCDAGDHELVCRRMIDLDEREDLPWAERPAMRRE